MNDMNEAAAKLHEMVVQEQKEPEIDSTTLPEETQNEETQTEEQDAEETEEATSETEEAEAESEEVTEDAESPIELDAEQLAQILGVENIDVNEDGKPIFKTKVDGEEGNATLNDLIERYQKDASLTNRGKELANIQAKRTQELNNFVQQTQQHATQFASILETLKDTFIQPMSNEQLTQLREDDPAAYAAAKADQRDREQAFSSLANQAYKEVTEAQKAQNEELQKQYAAYINEQKEILSSKIPEKTLPEVVSYLEAEGFTQSELSGISDARLFILAHKAMLHDKGIKGAKTKVVKKVPKLLKSGKSPSKSQVSIDSHKKAQDRLKETGSVDDAIAVLRSMRR